MYLLQGAITKRMTAIEEMAGMDVLCSDKTGTLTLNKLTVDKALIEVSVYCKRSSIVKKLVILKLKQANSKTLTCLPITLNPNVIIMKNIPLPF